MTHVFTPTVPQELTVLRSRGPLMAKTWKADGSIKGYDLAKHFTVERLPYASIDELFRHMVRLQGQPRACVIRGAPSPGLELTGEVTRTKENFVDLPSALCVLDVDNFVPEGIDPLEDPQAAIEQFIERCLPTCFHCISYVFQLSGSMGHPTKNGGLRVHLLFLLASPLTCAQLEAWASRHAPQCDHTVHRMVQVNYTAAPVIEPGAPADPLAGRRLGLVRGPLADLVEIPEEMPIPAEPLRSRGRQAMRDPRTKHGIVGAVCRAWLPQQIVELFPQHFARGSTPARITWLRGGGSAEGVCVTDDGLHLHNAHASAPLETGNLFDFIRAHVFGDLDAGVITQPARPSQRPSFRAAEAWARAQPAVVRELSEAAVAVPADPDGEPATTKPPMSASERADWVRATHERIKCAGLDELELQIGPEVAEVGLTDGDTALLIAAMQDRTRALLPPKGIAIKTIRRWAMRAPQGGSLEFPDLGPNGLPRLTMGNVAAVMAARGWTVRYNVISKEHELFGPGLALDTDNRHDAQLTMLASECARAGMAYKREAIAAMVVALGDGNSFNPVMDWIGSAPWDGRDRLQALYDTVETDPDFDVEVKVMLMRRWLLQCVAVASSPVPIQARGVLTFTGEQYIGKSKWLQSLVGPHRHLAMTGRMIVPNDKDSVRTAISAWLCELGELDATVQRAGSALLKAFLSQDTDRMRLPYAARDSRFQRRTSFFASVNQASFLADITGNTRFWPIPVRRVRHDHQIDMQQVWAQVLTLLQAGEQHWLTPDEMAQLRTTSAEHQAEDPLLEAIETRFAFDLIRVEGPPDPNLSWQPMTATQVAKAIGWQRPTPSEVSRIGTHLRSLGLERLRRKARARYWNLPVRAEQILSLLSD